MGDVLSSQAPEVGKMVVDENTMTANDMGPQEHLEVGVVEETTPTALVALRTASCVEQSASLRVNLECLGSYVDDAIAIEARTGAGHKDTAAIVAVVVVRRTAGAHEVDQVAREPGRWPTVRCEEAPFVIPDHWLRLALD